MRVLAIDPSINNLGWAILNSNCIRVFSGTIKVKGMISASIVARIGAVLRGLETTVAGLSFDVMVIEQPEPWGAYKSMASDKSGAMQKLTLIVGALAQWGMIAKGLENTHLIKVSTWKGQLPKGITQERMEKKYGCTFKTDHEADAVGLGDYFIEKEKRDANRS
ncbi:hypothetical protein LCGC14_0612940 [marine sediment metagenome]|uniref:Holliday junction nuclease RuvC n=1 Tax=marine sediment metagenome TaxID=412755 RepID=A0A0F9RRD3_9ZZZZ